MRCWTVGTLLAATCLAGCLHTPMSWSPDGSWLAYTVEVHAPDSSLDPHWLFEAGKIPPKPGGSPVHGYRLWATQAQTNASVLLEDSVEPLTAPGWSVDGQALAFGRVVTAPDRSARFEVVVLEQLTRRRILWSRPLTALDAEISRLPYQAIVWSPDNRYLAVPNIDPMGLAIIRVDNGRTVNVIPDAFLPSWSPAGGRLAFYVRSGGHALQYVESALGQPRPLIDVGHAHQAPAWTQDGSSIYVVARRESNRPGEATDPQELVRVQIRGDHFDVTPFRSLASELSSSREHTAEGVSITFDREAENLFCSTVVEGQPHQVVWYHPQENAVFKRFAMIDPLVPVGSLAFSSDGRTLAARVGTFDSLTAPILCDVESSDLKCRVVAPDDATRLAWIATLTHAARTILAKLPPIAAPGSVGKSRPLVRPTILPLPTDFAANSEMGQRLRKIGRIGRPLCDRLPGDAKRDPRSARVFDEAQFFFDYLRQDYGAALLKLASLESAAESSDERIAWMTLRAQILISQGQVTTAKRILTFLERIDQPSVRRLEWTGLAYQMTTETQLDRGWPHYLATLTDHPPVVGDLDKGQEPLPEPRLNRDLPLFRPANPFRPAQEIPAPRGGEPIRRGILRRGPAPPR